MDNESISLEPLTVVIPTRDRPDMLRGCVKSVRPSLGPDDELLVVDSASRQAEVRQVADELGCRYLRCDLPGASRARNLGWREAQNGLIAFIDDDVRVARTWAAGFGLAAQQHPDSAWFTGRIGVPQDQDARRPVAIKDEIAAAVIDLGTMGVLGHSANMAARREALQGVGGFDERLGPGGDFRNTEDLDLFDRFLAKGFLGRYAPDALAWHEQWRDERQLMRLDWTYGFGMGARTAKLVRTNRVRARQAAYELLWSWGLRDAIRFGRRRNKFMTATTVVRVAGGVAGFTRCVAVPLRDGHFAPRRRWTR